MKLIRSSWCPLFVGFLISCGTDATVVLPEEPETVIGAGSAVVWSTASQIELLDWSTGKSRLVKDFSTNVDGKKDVSLMGFDGRFVLYSPYNPGKNGGGFQSGGLFALDTTRGTDTELPDAAIVSEMGVPDAGLSAGRVAYVTRSGAIAVFDLASGQVTTEISSDGGVLSSVRFSQNHVVFQRGLSEIDVVDLPGGAVSKRVDVGAERLTGLDFSRDRLVYRTVDAGGAAHLRALLTGADSAVSLPGPKPGSTQWAYPKTNGTSVLLGSAEDDSTTIANLVTGSTMTIDTSDRLVWLSEQGVYWLSRTGGRLTFVPTAAR